MWARFADDVIEKLAAQSYDGAFTVDLKTQTILAPSGEVTPFPSDALQREALLEGLDEIGLTLKCADDISAWQRADRVSRPWVWQIEKVIV